MSTSTVLLTGLAGLLAGALSMGAGEWISVRSQRELLAASAPSVATEGVLEHLDVDENELALVYRARGMPAEEAERHAAEVLHSQELRAREPRTTEALDAVGSDLGAALSSFCFFASGAAVPVLPFLLGLSGARGPRGRRRCSSGSRCWPPAAIVGVLSGGPPLRPGAAPARHRRRRRGHHLPRRGPRGHGPRMTVTPSRGLTPADLDAVADLERRVVAADGGRLKLEWGTLRERDGSRVEDLLAWQGDRLVGFLGTYAFGGPAELAGMVDPDARGQGLGGELLDAALALLRERAAPSALLVVPRASAAGRALALARGGSLHHSEHALVLTGEPADGPSDPALTLRAAGPGDAAAVAALVTHGFGDPTTPTAADLARTLVAERDGHVVATLRADPEGGVYGFVVEPGLRGRGIGRDVLRRTCRRLLAAGVEQVHLEVEVDNEHALGLYTSLGFVRDTTEDYYTLPLG